MSAKFQKFLGLGVMLVLLFGFVIRLRACGVAENEVTNLSEERNQSESSAVSLTANDSSKLAMSTVSTEITDLRIMPAGTNGLTLSWTSPSQIDGIVISYFPTPSISDSYRSRNNRGPDEYCDNLTNATPLNASIVTLSSQFTSYSIQNLDATQTYVFAVCYQRNSQTPPTSKGNFAMAKPGTLFGSGTKYRPYGTGQFNVAKAADLNHDGILDLIENQAIGTTNALSNATRIRVMLGRGNGYFSETPIDLLVDQTLYATSRTADFVVADFNRDGHLDIANASWYNERSFIFLGRGDGTFEMGRPIDPQKKVFYIHLATADFNGDGQLDLIYAGHSDGRLDIYLGNGNGTFQSAMTFGDIAYGSSRVEVADVDGDGDIDIVHARVQQSGRTSIVWKNNGEMNFTQIAHSFVTMPTATKLGDFNGDGRVDLVVGHALTDTAAFGAPLRLYLNDGTGVFTQNLNAGFLTDRVINAIEAVDLNCDGRLDIVAGHRADSGPDEKAINRFYLGRGDGTFYAPVDLSSYPTGTDNIFAVDLNGDRAPDLVEGYNYAGPFLRNPRFYFNTLSYCMQREF